MLLRQIIGEVASTHVEPCARFQSTCNYRHGYRGLKCPVFRIQVLPTFFGDHEGKCPCTNHPGLSAHMFILFLIS